MNKLDNLKKGKRFSKDRQPEKNGRKKNVFKVYSDKYELSKTDVKNVINYVLSKDIKELEKIMKTPGIPSMLLAFISACITAIKKGDTRTLESLLDRSVGKVADKVDLTADGKVKLIISKDLLPDD